MPFHPDENILNAWIIKIERGVYSDESKHIKY